MVPPFLQPHPDLQSAVGNAPLSSKYPTHLPTTDCLLSITPLMGGQPSDAPALSPPSPLQQGGQSSNAPALSPPSPLPQDSQPIALALSPSSPPPQDGQPSDAPGLSPSSSTLLLCPSDSTLSICHLNSQSAVKTEVMCPPTWFYVNGSCLRPYIGAAVDIHQAIEVCDTWGGFLTTRLPSDGDVGRLLADVAPFRWSGHRSMGLMAPLESLLFRMVDGSLVSEFHFAEGQPLSATDQCLMMRVESGQWESVDCQRDIRFICQKDVAFSEVTLNNAQVSVSSVGSASIATVTCHEDHTFMHGIIEKSHVCTGGVWNPLIVDCKAICPELSAAFSDYTINETDAQTIAAVSCYHGYEYLGGAVSKSLECIQGNWNDTSDCQLHETIEKTLTCSLSGSWSSPSVDDCILS
ncbi:hypothetical protein ACOMHN_029798 [Nucella lapillus]